ncbi:MAG: aspartate aminotransferase family protein [Pseudomonadota bacterium]
MPPKARQILDMNAFDAAADGTPADALLARRISNFGASSVLFYARPIEMVRARGCWLEAADGTQYLDFYNNVPSVGHCHPGVVEAICDQVRALNINSRYLHRTTEAYLERLKASLPDGDWNIALGCTGSEANDLALRAAMRWTGGTGFVVTETAYHGNTSAVIEVSPASLKRGKPPSHVRTVPAPSRAAYGEDIAEGCATAVKRAIATLKRRGHAFAGLIVDSIFSSDGVFPDPPGFLAKAAQVAKDAGGLMIADEVQPGFGRTGTMWGFERHGLTPDIVTMGKPMGNGYPMSGMATRPEILARFCKDVGYFNTFGGTPVAAAAGLAVLDAIETDGLIPNAATTGLYLRDRLQALAARDPRVGDVRGAGLFLGIDLVSPEDGAPDPAAAKTLINALRDRRVLIGAAGRYGHTLKVRPPLSLSTAEADFFVDAIADALGHSSTKTDAVASLGSVV